MVGGVSHPIRRVIKRHILFLVCRDERVDWTFSFAVALRTAGVLFVY